MAKKIKSACCHAHSVMRTTEADDSPQLQCVMCKKEFVQATPGDAPTNPDMAKSYRQMIRSDNIWGTMGCLIFLVILVLLYFGLTSCFRFFSSDTGPNCHDRVSSEYVKGQLTDSEYLSKLNSQCGENN